MIKTNMFVNADLEKIKDQNELIPKQHSIKDTYLIKVKSSDMILGKDVMNDLEVFHPYDNNSFDSTIYKIFEDNCATAGGKLFVKDLLNNPIYNYDALSNRNECLKLFEKEDYPQHAWNILKEKENDFLWFFSQKEDTITDLLNSIYFSSWILNKMNNNDFALTSYNFYKVVLSPLFGLLSPIIYFIVPFLIIKYKFGNVVKLSFNTYIKLLYQSMTTSTNLFSIMNKDTGTLSKLQMISYVLSFVFYFQGLFNSFTLSHTTYKIIEFISTKVNNTFVYLKTCLELERTYWNNVVSKYQSAYLDVELNPINDDFAQSIKDYKPFTSFSIFSNIGKQMNIYKNFPKTDILNIVNRTYIIDAIYSVIKVKKDLLLTSPTFVKSDSPYFNSKSSWHICVNKTVSVKNDIDGKNFIITGPNAGGKSTIIKTICTNALLSQTLCVTSSKSTSLTPFYFINTQINIPDCKGVESLFEAEMNRCKYTMDTIREYEDKPCMIVMDEIFNSTNMVEAIAGAYSILEKIASYGNVMTIITTHFLYLTKLSKVTNFECYKMNVNIDKDTNEITYPYRLNKGVSKQYVALDLLKKRGFDESIINNAMKIKNKFIK